MKYRKASLQRPEKPTSYGRYVEKRVKELQQSMGFRLDYEGAMNKAMDEWNHSVRYASVKF